jgi:hypothetical protein
MTDFLLLATSAAWRKLNRICADASQLQKPGQKNAQLHAVNYISLAPYSTADANHHLEEVANEDAMAACSLSLYRCSLLFAYRHTINKDYQQAHEECNISIAYLQEGLNRLGITTELGENDLKTRARCFVNSLASQAELKEARTTKKIASHLVFVLGMHRSGTSALTGMLSQVGLAVPSDLMPATDANPKGYWESVSIERLNNEFMAEMESHWASSLPLPAGWSQSIACREWRTSLIKILSESFGGAELPIIKDPRFCTLISGLQPWFESELIKTSFFIPIRHPVEVANSLSQSEGIELNKALRLWIQSIFLTEKYTRGHKRKFISFDELINNPTNVLESCLQLMRVTADPEATGSMVGNLNLPKLETLSHAASYVEKRLRRQQAAISDKDFFEMNNICNTKLVDFAEKVFLEILANMADDEGISNALDELFPSMSLSSG